VRFLAGDAKSRHRERDLRQGDVSSPEIGHAADELFV
jgi:hypothetical protein